MLRSSHYVQCSHTVMSVVRTSDGNNRMIRLLFFDYQNNGMILIIQIIVQDIFIKIELIELFRKIACFTHCPLNTKLYKNISYDRVEQQI
jgi:hypothetical protein